MQYGGGGFNGVLITGLAPLRDAPLDLPPPVARGFMTYGTDSGHDNAKLKEIQEFALNDEALENFAHASYKKVRDVAVAMARSIYGRAPDKLYFFGGSEGGREGLTMAQRYPADFDGIVSVVPVINWVGLQFAGTRTGLVQMDGGWLSPAKVKLLHEAVLKTCDAHDGLADGIVGRTDVCIRAMNPKALRCADGKDTGDTCLSDAQINTVETARSAFRISLRAGQRRDVLSGIQLRRRRSDRRHGQLDDRTETTAAPAARTRRSGAHLVLRVGRDALFHCARSDRSIRATSRPAPTRIRC